MNKIIILLGAMFVFSFCSKEKKSCVDELCTAGQKICLPGSVYRATCTDDGKGYDIKKCSLGFHCEDGECKTNSCTPGTSICKDDSTFKVCDSIGTGYKPEQKCEPDENGVDTTCINGLCLIKNCIMPGQKICGSNFVLVCQTDGSGWARTDCAQNTVCDNETKECVSYICEPGTRKCAGDTSYEECSVNGKEFGNAVSCPTEIRNVLMVFASTKYVPDLQKLRI